MAGVTVPETGPLYVERGRVVRVNAREYSVDVTTAASRPAFTVPIGYPYAHTDHAGGIHYLPEENSTCYVAFPAEGSPFVLAFVVDPKPTQVPEHDYAPRLGYNHRKVPLEPGDIRIATMDGNYVALRKGGIVQIAATPLAQIMLLPMDNLLRFYFERFQCRSPLGEIDWGHVSFEQLNVDAAAIEKTPVLVRYSIKEYAQENITKNKYTVELRVGRLTDDTLVSDDARHKYGAADKDAGTHDGVISVVVHDHAANAETPPVTFSFQVARTGEGLLTFAKELRIHAKENVYITGDKLVQLSAGKTSTKLTETALSVSTETATVEATKTVMIQGGDCLVLKCGNASITLHSSGDISVQGNIAVSGGATVAGVTRLGGEGAIDGLVRQSDLLLALQIPLAVTGAVAKWTGAVTGSPHAKAV